MSALVEHLQENLASHRINAADTSAVADLRLCHDDWEKLCSSIGLTAFEAKKLHHMIQDESSHDVSVGHVANVLSSLMAFDASFMQLAAGLLDRYGSLRSAFAEACINQEHLMGWHEFRKLSQWLDISERNASKMWSAFLTQLPATCVPSPSSAGDDKAPADSITEDQFVDLLVPWTPDLLSWAPNLALDAFQRQVNENFANLGECRLALRQQGLPESLELSPQRLQDGLLSVGVLRCDADVILSKARHVAGLSANDQVTFDDVVEAMRSSWHVGREGAPDLVEKEGMRIWQQLNDEEHAHLMHMRRGNSSCSTSTQASPTASRGTSSPASRSSSKASVASVPSLPAPGATNSSVQARRRQLSRPSRMQSGSWQDANSALPKLFESSQEFLSPLA
jgi:hypothetical protein